MHGQSLKVGILSEWHNSKPLLVVFALAEYALEDYQGNLLLVGINYDKTTKKHECVIERIQKGD